MAAKGSGKGLAFLRANISFDGEECLIWPFCLDAYGYGQFGLDGETLKAHRWMCEAVHGPAPANKPYAAHDCGNGHLTCIHPKHLQWKTQLENAQDAVQHGTSKKGKGYRRVKLTEVKVAEIKALRGTVINSELARIYGVSLRTIVMIFQGRIWNGGKYRLRGFSDEEVRHIRSLKGSAKVTDLASEYEVKPNVIYKIQSGHSWTHVS